MTLTFTVCCQLWASNVSYCSVKWSTKMRQKQPSKHLHLCWHKSPSLLFKTHFPPKMNQAIDWQSVRTSSASTFWQRWGADGHMPPELILSVSASSASIITRKEPIASSTLYTSTLTINEKKEIQLWQAVRRRRNLAKAGTHLKLITLTVHVGTATFGFSLSYY